MKLLALAIALAAAPAAAQAGESACWFEGGVVVVPAEVMGVAGDYVLDTGAPHTELAQTQAQAAGFGETVLTGPVRIADLEVPTQSVAVANLDRRLYALPTPVAGVIGADLLKAYVVDVRFAPCRVGIYAPGHAPRFGRAQSLPLTWVGERPTAQAAASDGPRSRAGAFTLSTGADTPIRLSDAAADAPGAKDRQALYPYGRQRPTLRAFSFAGQLTENAPSGLLAAGEAAGLGELGAPALASWRLRFDFPAGRLLLAKKKGLPGKPGRP